MRRSIQPASPEATRLELGLSGHLDLAQLDQKLAELASRLPPEGAPLLVDATQMTGYDVDARDRFVAWNREHKSHIVGVAIVTRNLRWHMVIRAMALASGQHLCPFDALEPALEWCAASRR
jgi:hypothetical protein